MELGKHFLENSLKEFRRLKTQGDKALAQVSDEEFFRRIDADSNSLALIVKHVAGNLHSRWRDFLTTDGEKPERNRDAEFEQAPADSREQLMHRWEEGWAILFRELEPLGPDDLLRTVTIRSEPHTVVQCIQRQLTHYGEHCGQIVFLAKHLLGPRWQTLSIPRGQSEQFNQQMLRHFAPKK
ncbi:MAG TPA: DUF1572 family protein [Candidatus Nitrosotenuis sp.]|nr:DUF1572 family protein [Candidatus Nitrosotenuis sp.]